MPTSYAARERRLHALGVTPYRLRGQGAPEAAAASPEPTVQAPSAPPIPCALLLPASCAARDLDRIGRAMHAFGVDFARAPRVQVPSTGLREAPPTARAYLAFGEAQARALGQVLTAAAMGDAEVVLLDAPGLLGQGAAKRRLWLAVKALQRRLRTH